MANDYHDLIESLKEFIIESQDDKYNAPKMNFYKYNNLKITMDSSKPRKPNFIVRVGISEAMFSLGNCEKISGGLGSDEKYVHRWFDKTHVRMELQDSWKKLFKVEPVSIKDPNNLQG